MTRNLMRALVVVILGVCFVAGGVATASAALDDTPTVTSSTNPSEAVGANWWRMGWGNSVYPQFSIAGPSVGATEVLGGFLYTVDRDPATVIDTSTPYAYYRSVKPSGTHLTQILDMQGIYAYDPTPPLEPGAVGIEGTWFYHFRPFSSLGYSSNDYVVPFGIDLTPPAAVDGLEIRPSVDSIPLPGAWLPQRRIHVVWTPDNETSPYDSLSGVAYYQVLIDGAPVVPGTDTGYAWEIPGLPSPGSITIEDVPPGAHELSIVCVDRAGNEGPASSAMFYSDTDTPTVQITDPAGTYLKAGGSVSATATDLGGIARVVFRIDGTVVGTATTAPYSVIPDLSGVSQGVRTLTATVRDMCGREVTDSRAIVVDTLAPDAPVVSSATHPSSASWYNAVEASMTWTASDAGSGIAGYSYTWSDSPTTDPDTTSGGSVAAASQASGSDGQHYFHVRALDTAGNWGATAHFLYRVDKTAPTTPYAWSTTHPLPEYNYASTAPAMQWTTTETVSSIAGASYVWDDDPGTVPDAVVDSALSTATLPFAPDGVHYFHVRVVDQAGNWTEPAHVAYRVDSGAPHPYKEMALPDPAGTSSTNPNAAPDAWRMGWGNTLEPQFALNPPADAQGLRYVVDRSFSTVIAKGTPGAYSLSPVAPGTLFNKTLDIAGVEAYPPFGGWVSSPAQPAGATPPYEGWWYWHFMYYAGSGGAERWSKQVDANIGIDLTAPQRVTNVLVSPAVGVAGAATASGPSKRVIVSWDGGDYDALSGTAYYSIYMDGVLKISGLTDVDTGAGTVQAPLWYMPSWSAPYSIAIEDLTPGRHVIQVTNTDRATNESTVSASAVYFASPDTPAVSIIRPSDSILYTNGSVEASVTSLNGAASVAFALDGVPIGTATSAPWTVTPTNLGTFTPGAYTLTAEVTDLFGRTGTASKPVTLSVPPVGPVTPPTNALTQIAIAGVSLPLSSGTLWVNSTQPFASFSSTVSVDGFIYTVDRASGSMPALPRDPALPPSGFLSVAFPQMSASTVLDMRGWLAEQTVPPVAVPGASDGVEGTWWVHGRAFLSSGVPAASPEVRHVQFNVDVTPPSAPTGLVSLSGASSSWSSNSRADLAWYNPLGAGTPQYDTLSGDSMWAISLNGVDRGEYRIAAAMTTGNYTVEGLLPGRNVVGVSVIDVAGNRGSEATMALLSDPDAPTVSIVVPSGGTLLTNGSVQAVPVDSGGVASVVFAIDGVPIGTATAWPWAVTPTTLGSFSLGAHTLTAVATDMMGRTATATKAITLAAPPTTPAVIPPVITPPVVTPPGGTTPAGPAPVTFVYPVGPSDVGGPSLTRMSAAPNPFYPVRRDRYKDTMKISFRLGKASAITISIYNSSGTLVRTVTTSRKAGAQYVLWDGKSAGGKVSTGTFYVVITATAGGKRTSAKAIKTTIRNYEVVRVSRSKLKIVPR